MGGCLSTKQYSTNRVHLKDKMMIVQNFKRVFLCLSLIGLYFLRLMPSTQAIQFSDCENLLLAEHATEFMMMFFFKPQYDECLNIMNSVLGENHPDTLKAMTRLAAGYMNKSEYRKALPLYEECLRMSKVISGENHPNTLSAMNTLANIYFDLEEYGKALPLYEESLRLRKVV